MGDEFGGPIPCGGFALIGGEEIGKVVDESIGSSVACLLKNHSVFTIGKNAAAAVKAPVMTEDVAAGTVWLALQLGQPEEIAPDRARSCTIGTRMSTGSGQTSGAMTGFEALASLLLFMNKPPEGSTDL